MILKPILLILLISYTFSIGIQLQMYQPKCMIVYTVGQSQTVKINIKFPQIPGQLPHQHYQVVILNTQSNQIVTQQTRSGTYKRQLSLSSNVIYQVCFKVISQREFGRILIQYTAENLFNLQQSQIKVPQNLLKSGDFKVAYSDTQKLSQVANRFIQLQTTRKSTQAETFNQTVAVNQNLVYISIIQIAMILVAGVYQFWKLRKYLESKQYI